jgi:hypothetical protein
VIQCTIKKHTSNSHALRYKNEIVSRSTPLQDSFSAFTPSRQGHSRCCAATHTGCAEVAQVRTWYIHHIGLIDSPDVPRDYLLFFTVSLAETVANHVDGARLYLHQRTFCSSPRSYMSMKSHGGMILTGKEKN